MSQQYSQQEFDALRLQFRQQVYSGFISKGIQPPSNNSPREDELFAQWLRGHEKLEHHS